MSGKSEKITIWKCVNR